MHNTWTQKSPPDNTLSLCFVSELHEINKHIFFLNYLFIFKEVNFIWFCELVMHVDFFCDRSVTCVCPEFALTFVDTFLFIGDHLEIMPCPVKCIRSVVVVYEILCRVLRAPFCSECSAMVECFFEICKHCSCIHF